MAAPEPQLDQRLRWSWRIGAPFGIGVYVHATFLLLIAWVVLGPLLAGLGAAAAVAAVVFVVAVFAIVVLHELGHALTARRYGIRTRAITLLPIGGVASLERMPDRPHQELAIALAGPAVNVALAAALGGVLVLLGRPPELPVVIGPRAPLLAQLFWVNVSMAVFNLVPAFPMDGGRVLRALLSLAIGPLRATIAAARVAKVFAVGFALIGLLLSPGLALIALFVWLGADAELGLARLRGELAALTVAQAMDVDPATVGAAEPLGSVAARTVARHAHDFVVLADGAVCGVLSHDALVRGLATVGPDAPVAAAMRRDVPAVAAGDPLDRAFDRLRADAAGAALVIDGDHPVGLLTLDGLAELITLRQATALGRRRQPPVTDARFASARSS